MTMPRQTGRVELELAGEYPGVLTISAWKNLGICTWVSQANGPAVDVLYSVMDKLKVGHERSSWVHLIRDRAGLPDVAARTGFVRMMTERHAELGCVAVVVGGKGFWASAMRNAVIGLRVFAPRKFELRLHGSVEEVVEWLPPAHEKATGVVLQSATLSRMLAQAQKFEPSSSDQLE